MKRIEGKKKNFFLRGVLLFAAIYTLVSVVSLQLKISEAKIKLTQLQEQMANQQNDNSVLDDLLAANELKQAEQSARDKLGLVYPEERVYIDIS